MRAYGGGEMEGYWGGRVCVVGVSKLVFAVQVHCISIKLIFNNNNNNICSAH